MENIITKTLKTIEICDVDYMNRFKIYRMFTEFTQLATTNAELIGLWNKEHIGKYGWVVAKQTLTLDEPIHVDDIVEFSTIIGNSSAAVFPRYYFIKKDGREIGRCSSIWTLIDLKARRIVIPKRLGFIIPVVNHGIKLDTPKNIDDNLELKEVCKRQVLFSDVDLNQHMNNAKYIDWALDSIDYDIHKEHFIHEVSVHYKKEIRPLEYVSIFTGNDGLRYVVEGRNDEGEVFFKVELIFKQEN